MKMMRKPTRLPLRRVTKRPRPASPAVRARASAAGNEYDESDYGAEEEPNMKFSHALLVVLALHIIAVGGVFAFNSIKAGQAGRNLEKPAEPPPVAAATPKPAPARNPVDGWKGRTHTVQAGDTLTRIATLHKTTVEAIEKENAITSYSLLRVGQVLKIPERPADPPKPATDPHAVAAKKAFIEAKTGQTVGGKAEIPPAPAPSPAAATQQPVKAPAAPVKTPAGPAKALAEPAKAPAEPAKAPAAPPKAPATAAGDVYVVAKGDNPYSIAKKLHVSYKELLAVNGITDPTKVQIGQKLKLPDKKP